MTQTLLHNDSLPARECCERLRLDLGWPVRTIDQPLNGEPAVSVVLDLTDPVDLDGIEEFLDELIRTRKQVRLVTINDGTIPARLVERLELFQARHIELYKLKADSLREALDACDPGVTFPERCEIESAGISVHTYDSRLFEVYEQVRRIAVHDVTLLVIGETGTGKTTLARLIHDCSPRREGPFKTVACGTLPPDIIESELFGHERGAFTGANQRKEGRFASAAKGTLLLDEVDVLGNKQQAMLLRVLETGEYEPVGSTETKTSDARLIVASNVELETLAESNRFRADLYYRLNVLEVRLPPLRDRPIDLIPLAMEFIRQAAEERNIPVNRVELSFLRRVRRYPWPGNLRELKNHVQRAVLFSDHGVLVKGGLSPKILDWREPVDGVRTGLAAQVASAERTLVEQALRENGYKRTATAKALGISRVGLYKKMKRLGLIPGSV